MIMQLSELERKAYREGDTEKAEIIAQLIDTLQALEDLTEKADALSTILINSKGENIGLLPEFVLFNTNGSELDDVLTSISKAQQTLRY